eukprot:5678852-Pyramimonas_sp.AAC.1
MKRRFPRDLTGAAQAALVLLRVCTKVSLFGVSTYRPVLGYPAGGVTRRGVAPVTVGEAGGGEPPAEERYQYAGVARVKPSGVRCGAALPNRRARINKNNK